MDRPLPGLETPQSSSEPPLPTPFETAIEAIPDRHTEIELRLNTFTIRVRSESIGDALSELEKTVGVDLLAYFEQECHNWRRRQPERVVDEPESEGTETTGSGFSGLEIFMNDEDEDGHLLVDTQVRNAPTDIPNEKEEPSDKCSQCKTIIPEMLARSSREHAGKPLCAKCWR